MFYEHAECVPAFCRRYKKYLIDVIQLREVRYLPSRVSTTRDFREDIRDSYKYGKKAGNRNCGA